MAEVMAGHGGNPLNKLVMASLALWLSATAVYTAVNLIASVWPLLLGIGMVVGGIWLAVVVIRTRRNHW